MPRKLSDYRSENPITYNLLSDPLAANLIIALPLNKQYGLRDISNQIRGSGTEHTNFSYVKINTSNIVRHQSCFYDSCLRIPHVARNQGGNAGVIDLGIGATQLGTDDLGTDDFTIECWMYFESFDFEEFSIMHPYRYNDGNANGDVPSLVVFGDNKSTFGNRRKVSFRRASGSGGAWVEFNRAGNSPSGGALSTALLSGTLSPRIWYYIAAHKRTSATEQTYAISIGSRENDGSLDAVDGFTSSGARTITDFTTNLSSQTPSLIHDFVGNNYQFFYSKFNNGRMPVGVYAQDLKVYKGVTKSTPGKEYRVPDPILVY